MAKDPICGIEVDNKTAIATSKYEGRTYHFCATGCKNMFDANPVYWSDPNYFAYLWYGGRLEDSRSTF